MTDATGATGATGAAGVIRVVLVDDNPMVRAGVRALLEVHGGFDVVAEAGDGEAGLAAVRAHRPDVTLLDHRMPVAEGLDVLTRISEVSRTILLTSDGSEAVVARALADGASGFLTYGELRPDDLVAAVTAVAGGRAWLSPGAATVAVHRMRLRAEAAGDRRVRFGLTARERELVGLLVEGATNAEIAGRLFVSEKTVKNHLNHIYAKLGVSNRGQAVARWQG